MTNESMHDRPGAEALECVLGIDKVHETRDSAVLDPILLISHTCAVVPESHSLAQIRK